MTKVPIDSPFFPSELEVQAQPVMGDLSIRQESGIEMVVCWKTEGGERGMHLFFSEADLTGDESKRPRWSKSVGTYIQWLGNGVDIG